MSVQRIRTQIRTFITALAAFAMILSVGVTATTPTWAAEQEGIVLTHEAKSSGNADPSAFATGELMQSQATFKANLPSSEYAGAYLAISYPREAASFVGSIEPVINYASSEVFDHGQLVGNEYRIYLKDSDDARDTSFPILTKFSTFITPDGYELPLTLSLKKADGSLVKSANVVTYKAIAGGADYSYSIVGGQNQIGGKSSDGKVLDSTGLVDVTFTYAPDFRVFNKKDPYSTFADEKGARLYNPLNLVQPLPEHASFDPAKNPGWSLNDATKELTYTLDRKDFDDDHYRPVSLKLTFPGAPVDQTFTTTSTMTFNLVDPAANETPVVQTKTVSYRFRSAPPEGSPIHKTFIKADNDPADQYGTHNATLNDSSRLNAGLKWGLTLQNTHTAPLTITSFTDHDLDPRLYYAGVSLPYDESSEENSGIFASYENFKVLPSVTVVAQLEDGTTQTMGTVRRGRTLTFSNTDTAKKITSLSFTLPDGFTLNTNQYSSIGVVTKFKDAPSLSSDQAQNRYSNSVSYEGHHENAHGDTYDVHNQASEYFTLVPKKIDIGFQKTLSDKLGTGWFAQTRDEPVRADGELALWNWGSWFSGMSSDAIKGVPGSEVIENLEIIDLLPEGVTYDEATTKAQSRGITSYGTITYHENYEDSGLNAVVISFPRISVSRFNRLVDNESLAIATRVNSDSLPGKNVNTMLVKVGGQFVANSDTHHMSGQGYSFSGLNEYADTRDLDHDGDTNEKFAYASAHYEYTAKQELIARTYIARADVDNFNRDGLKTGVDTPFRYKLYNYNNKVSAIRQYELVSLLPYIGDHSSAKDATSNDYKPRNSQFANTLTGPAEITTKNASKFVVLYTTDKLEGAVADASTSLTWTESVDDYSKVTGIKVALKDGQSFASGEELDVIAPMKAPSDAALADRAYADFAISSDGSDFVPTNRVWNEIYEPSSDLIITKTDDNNAPLAGAKFRVTNKADDKDTREITTGSDGKAQVTLPLGQYTVTESEAPTGYVLSETTYDADIVEDVPTELSVTNQPRNLVVTKVDSADATKKLAGATFELRTAGGTVVGQPQTTNDDGQVTFSKLAIGTYQLVETQEPGGYVLASTPVSVTVENAGATVQVTNTLIEKGDITATKVWADGPTDRPEIRFALYRQIADGQAERVPGADIQIVPTEGSVTWNAIDKTDNHGAAYTFSVKEVDANGDDYTPSGYTKTEDGLTVTNTYVPELTTVTARKVWVGGPEADHTDVSLQLWQAIGDDEPTKVGEPVTTTGLTATWENIPITNTKGEAITYSVTEENIPTHYAVSYDVDENGFTVTNTLVNPEITVPVTKVWDDADNQDGIRPDSVKVKLQTWVEEDPDQLNDAIDQNGNTVEPLTLSATSNWTGEFTNLPLYDSKGRVLTYSVVEDTVEGYQSTVDIDENGVTVTNTHEVAKTNVDVSKVWVDAEDKDGIRPGSVTFKLLADGEDTGKTLTVDAQREWKGAFEGLAKFKTGKEIVYTISEVPVEGYTSEVAGNAADGFVVTNTHEIKPEPTPSEEPSPSDEPTDPTTPSEPATPSEEPTTPVNPTTPSKPASPETPRTLPFSGTSVVSLGVLAMAALVGGVVILRRREEA
ncbi:Cna B-type domain-containing protein [Arcanobacterium haemolyticum]|nr:Cna B-type domain-containing protein [Arcanobacterium haemolyticum]